MLVFSRLFPLQQFEWTIIFQSRCFSPYWMVSWPQGVLNISVPSEINPAGSGVQHFSKNSLLAWGKKNNFKGKNKHLLVFFLVFFAPFPWTLSLSDIWMTTEWEPPICGCRFQTALQRLESTNLHPVFCKKHL